MVAELLYWLEWVANINMNPMYNYNINLKIETTKRHMSGWWWYFYFCKKQNRMYKKIKCLMFITHSDIHNVVRFSFPKMQWVKKKYWNWSEFWNRQNIFFESVFMKLIHDSLTWTKSTIWKNVLCICGPFTFFHSFKLWQIDTTTCLCT